MKIAIPTSDGIRISSNIQTIKGFKVFDIQEGKITDENYIPCHDKENIILPSGGNGEDNEKEVNLESSMLSCIEDCQIMIANGLGKKMFEEVERSHKEVYITEATHVRGAINHFIRQTLRNHPEIA